MNKSELRQFTGTSQWYKHPLFGYLYTDGIKYLAENANAYWLIDIIFSFQNNEKIKNDKMLRQFQFWKLIKHKDDSATLICERDKDDVAFTTKINFTDFPLNEIDLWFTNKTLILPSEY